MVGWPIYSRIQELKALGLNQSQVARYIEVNVKTVNKYWDLDATGYVALVEASAHHKSQLDEFEDAITGWLGEHPV